MEQIVAFEKRKHKKNVKKSQKNIGFIVAIVLLSIALVGTNLLSFFGIWRNLFPAIQPQFALGKSAVLQAELDKSSSLGFEFKGSAVSNIFYSHQLSIEMPITPDKYLLRAKAVVNNGQTFEYVQIANNSNWVQADDGYYYFCYFALGGEQISFCNGIILPEIQTKQEKTYQLIFTVESLNENVDYQNIWELPDNFEILQTIQD